MICIYIYGRMLKRLSNPLEKDPLSCIQFRVPRPNILVIKAFPFSYKPLLLFWLHNELNNYAEDLVHINYLRVLQSHTIFSLADDHGVQTSYFDFISSM
jgi:hypothetical protein